VSRGGGGGYFVRAIGLSLFHFWMDVAGILWDRGSLPVCSKGLQVLRRHSEAPRHNKSPASQTSPPPPHTYPHVQYVEDGVQESTVDSS